jgi:hypothetical protein
MRIHHAALAPDELMLRVEELEAAAQLPKVDGNLNRAVDLAMLIARSTPDGPVSNTAMKLMSAAIVLKSSEASADLDAIKQLVSKLRTLVEKTKSDSPKPT